MNKLDRRTIDEIKAEYRANKMPWYLGYSGGKDSSALLKLVYIALKELETPKKEVTIIYCDTGVEIPLIRAYVLRTLDAILLAAEHDGVPLTKQIASPGLTNSYFVKVIGRGYPPPTNKFRWCTDRLRISPVDQILANERCEENIVLLGVRKGESTERDKTISKHQTENDKYFRQAKRADRIIYSPIVDYSTDDVWSTLMDDDTPGAIDTRTLADLYKSASGECPLVRDPVAPPCAKGRFGCWTCTVVRRDRAMENITLEEKYTQLSPLLEFRNWLLEIRDMPAYRCSRRRNGVSGLGPFTLDAREEILGRLFAAQAASGWDLITEIEVAEITRLWDVDRQGSWVCS